MKTLVIPDIHNKHQKVQDLLDKLEGQFDQCIFLGDYFDDFDDWPKDVLATARWLAKKLIDPKFICLWGNHDQSYLAHRSYRCSGWSEAKNILINKTITKDLVDKLMPAVIVEGWLLSHAGFTRQIISKNPLKIAEINLPFTFEGRPPIFGIGQVRGGDQPFGGITWCDFYNEFKPHPKWKQIFGHTQGRTVRETSDCGEGRSICLDTSLRHYAIIENGKVEIKEWN